MFLMRARARKLVAVLVVVLVAGLAGLARCNRLPAHENRPTSAVMPDTAATRLGRAVGPRVAAHPGLCGIHPLGIGRDAFAARYLLAEAAERTLDVQYYIWRNDLSGTLLMKALVDAADRGVRVRLLLDDNNTSGLDTALAAIDSHPGIEVRLFNPYVIRKPRLLGLLTDLRRLNRRMHNKSFTADNQITIIGGRNVGDEYFEASGELSFADLDVIGIGPVVSDVSRDFDEYWNSPSSYPAQQLLTPVDAAAISELSFHRERVERGVRGRAYKEAVRASSFVGEVLMGTLPLEWAPTRMISDPPSKVLGRADRKELLFQKFGEIFGSPAQSVDLVSPYFVPGATGVELLARWAGNGVDVRVLTNSLEATDVPVVHTGYAKRRKALLKEGVTLYEWRPTATRPQSGSRGSFGSSDASLHAKTFAVDRSRVFIGSFNFDPRSAELNTEMGFVIDSPALAGRIDEAFEKAVPMNSYMPQLTDDGLVWVEHRGKEIVRHQIEPGAGFWKRTGISLLSMLPIDPLL
jgi:putative cardiolipin synthase